jgi:hypothetical protein
VREREREREMVPGCSNVVSSTGCSLFQKHIVCTTLDIYTTILKKTQISN